VRVYVWTKEVSEAVTTTVIVLTPTLTAIAPVATPEVATLPFTVTVAAPELVVGVTVTEVTELATLDMYAYVPEANTGESTAAPERVNAERSASEDGTAYVVVAARLVPMRLLATTRNEYNASLLKAAAVQNRSAPLGVQVTAAAPGVLDVTVTV
jgi:hypothetical protein